MALIAYKHNYKTINRPKPYDNNYTQKHNQQTKPNKALIAYPQTNKPMLLNTTDTKHTQAAK